MMLTAPRRQLLHPSFVQKDVVQFQTREMKTAHAGQPMLQSRTFYCLSWRGPLIISNMGPKIKYQSISIVLLHMGECIFYGIEGPISINHGPTGRDCWAHIIFPFFCTFRQVQAPVIILFHEVVGNSHSMVTTMFSNSSCTHIYGKESDNLKIFILIFLRFNNLFNDPIVVR